MGGQVTSCNTHGVTPLGCVRNAKPYGGKPAYPFAGGQCQTKHTKKSHPVVGLIVLMVLGYLVYRAEYLAIH